MSGMKNFLIDQLSKDILDPKEEDMATSSLGSIPRSSSTLASELAEVQSADAVDGSTVTLLNYPTAEEKAFVIAQTAKEIMQQHESVLARLNDSTDIQKLEMLLEVLKKHEGSIRDLATQAYNSPYNNMSVHKSYLWGIECIINRLRMELME